MKKFTTIFYKGLELEKTSKTSWNIKKNGTVKGYAKTLKEAKKAIDERNKNQERS